MKIEGSTVAVIGGAGFIGSHVVDALLGRGAKVRVLDNLCRGSRDNLRPACGGIRMVPESASLDFTHGDITHPDVVREVVDGCDGVVHLAALWLLHCDRYREAAFRVNVEGTFNVLRACEAAGVGRVVFSSSASVYGNAVETPMVEGSHPLGNRSFYGATKVAGEQMVRALMPGVGVSLRYMNVYGERQDDRGAYVAVLMRWLRAREDGEPITIHGDGSQTYDFIHVSDVARANIAALESDAVGEFNVGTGVGTSLAELSARLVEAAADEAGCDAHNPVWVPGPDHYVTKRIGCPVAARDALGFTAEVDLDEGLRRLVRWWMAR